MPTSKFALKYRRPVAAESVGVKDSSTALAGDTEYATITCGQGVPSSTTEPNGSLFLRRDGSDAATVIYARIAGAWVPIVGT